MLQLRQTLALLLVGSAWGQDSPGAATPAPASAPVSVVDAQGLPVAGARVFTCDWFLSEGECSMSVPAPDREQPSQLDEVMGMYLLLLAGPEAMRPSLDGGTSFTLAGATDSGGPLNVALHPCTTAVWAESADVGSSGLVAVAPEGADRTRPLTLTLRPRGVVRGAVADFVGGTVPDTVVFVPLPPGDGARARQPEPAILGEDGEFSIEVDAPCAGPILVRKGPHWSRLADIAVEPGETTQLALALRPSGQVRGTVVDEQGQPVTSGVVRGFPWWRHPGLSTDIDQRGSFVLDIPSGALVLEVEAIGNGFASAEGVPVTPGSPQQEPIQLVVSRQVHVRGRVVDQDGRPVAGAAVDGSVEEDGSSMCVLRSLGGLEGFRLTDEDGRFAFGGLVPGCAYRIYAYWGSERRAEARSVLPGTEDLVLTLPPDGASGR